MRFAQSIVAAGADDQKRRIAGQARQLSRNVARHRAIDGKQCRLPLLRQARAKLPDYIRCAADIGAIVEDGVANENNVPGRWA